MIPDEKQTDNKALLKITIPDGTPEEQIKMITEIMEVTKSLATLVGEPFDDSAFLEAIEKIKENKEGHA